MGIFKKELSLWGRFTVEDKLVQQLLEDLETMVLSSLERRERKECSKEGQVQERRAREDARVGVQ